MSAVHLATPGNPARRLGLVSLAVAALLGSAGCTTLGGNVRGDFACRAPGGSCSPMSAIDSRAVDSVLGAGRSEAAEAEASPPQPLRLHGATGAVARTAERTLRIVFPAHVDTAGVLHDEATAHVVVEGAAWTLAAPGRAADPAATITPVPDHEISRSPAPSSLREAIAGASAPAIEGLESLPAQAPHPIAGVAAPSGAKPAGPSAEAIAAARSGRRIARPTGIDLGRAPPERSQTLPATVPAQTLPSGKPQVGSAGAAAAGRVRALGEPAIRQLGRPAQDEPDLDGVFAHSSQPKDAPR